MRWFETVDVARNIRSVFVVLLGRRVEARAIGLDAEAVDLARGCHRRATERHGDLRNRKTLLERDLGPGASVALHELGRCGTPCLRVLQATTS